jgi:glucose-1-phosphate cytidylyltransferase
MVEIGGRPILWHIMKHLGSHGVTDFIVAAGYRSEVIKQYFLDYDARNNDFTITLGARESLHFHGDHEETDWTVTVADTGPDTLTAGRVIRAARYLDGSPFIVAYGDGVADVDVTALLRFHRESGTLATVTTVQPTSRYGVLDMSADGRVVSFREKPQLDGWINIGYFVFEPEVLSHLTDGLPLETEPLAALAGMGQLSAFRHTGFWQPMDTYRESEMLNRLWAAGEAPWKTWQ